MSITISTAFLSDDRCVRGHVVFRRFRERARRISRASGPACRGPPPKLLTTDFVLIETGNHFSRVGDRASFLSLLPDLNNDKDVVIPATSDVLERGIQLYSQRLDKSWSVTDCTSFLVMEEFGIKDALTTDHDFEQAGFTILFK